MEVKALPATNWKLLVLVFTLHVLVRLSGAQSGSELATPDQSPYILFGSSSVGKFVLNGSEVTDPNGEKLITSCRSTVNVVNYYYQMDKLFWVAGNKVFMSNLTDISNRDCSAQTIVAEEIRRPVALAVDWIHNKLFWILEDDHTFNVEQIVEYDLITMDEARVVTNLSVTTVQWLAVYPFPDNGSSVLMWIEQVDRSKGYDLIFISSDTESKERHSIPQLVNCRILSQYLNVPDGTLYFLASCLYSTILYSFDLAVRQLSLICYLRTTLGIAIFRDILYTYSPLQLYFSHLEGAGPEHDLYLKEIGHQRNSGDRYRHIVVVDQSLQPAVNEIPPWEPFVTSSISLQLSTALESFSTYTASITAHRPLPGTTAPITSSVEYTPMQYTSSTAVATPFPTQTTPSPSAYSSISSSNSVPLSLSVYSSTLSSSDISSFGSVVRPASTAIASSLSKYSSVMSSSSLPAPTSLVNITTTLLQSLMPSTELLRTSTISASTLPSSAVLLLLTSSTISTSPLPSTSVLQLHVPNTSPPRLATDSTNTTTSTLEIHISPITTIISEEPKSEDILRIVVPVTAAAAVVLLIITIGIVVSCIICWCRRRASAKKKELPKFYLYYSEPVARHPPE